VGGLEGRASADISASPGACLATLLDVGRYPEWYPLVEEVRVLERDADGRGISVEAATHVAVKTIRYRVHYRADDAGGLRGNYLGGDLKSLEVHWRLDPLGDDRTQAELELRGTVGLVLDRLMAPFRAAIRRELVDDAVSALARRVEEPA
jgi:ribosome-associated toxin RatA of RatAB toxin-antitoxin module